MKLSLGFSPCPNDTFIFDALVNKKIDTLGLEFDVITEDVQQLNNRALENNLDISKISYGVLPLILENYNILQAGGALGFGVGPLLICKNENLLNGFNPKEIKVAVPGKNTTANLLFSLAYPDITQKSYVLFSEIEKKVLNNQFDLGVIIHENRFTYEKNGLKKIIDLGDFWEKTTGNPIPLGGIVTKKNLPKDLSTTLNKLIKQSIEFAYQFNFEELPTYVTSHAQEMLTAVMKQHIDLYVNDFSLDLGKKGKAAVELLVETYYKLYPEITKHPITFIK